MKALRKRPGEAWEEVEIENTLEALQAEVGGYIETVAILSDLVLVVNEEGRINGMRFNMELCGMHLFGTILAVGYKGDNLCDVPETHLKDILY